MVKKSLALQAAVIDLEFTFCGRHGSGNRILQVQNYYKRCSDPEVDRALKSIVKQLIRAEAHISENVVKKNYEAFKEQVMSAFTSFDSANWEQKFTDRWSSHPDFRPSSTDFPYTFVEPDETATGSLKTRCHDFRKLTIDEQNGQLFWLRNLREVWAHRDEIDGWCNSPSWTKFKKTMDASLKEAQEKWDAKFGKTWTESAAEACQSVLATFSPTPNSRKRPRDDGASSSAKRMCVEHAPE